MTASKETISLRLAQFEHQAIETRKELHAELEQFARRNYVPNLHQRHARIEAIESWEAKAFELLARGVDPGKASIAFVEQFVANAYGDPYRGLRSSDATSPKPDHTEPPIERDALQAELPEQA